MRALTISRPGGPEVLAIRDVPDPAPAAQEVLVRVRAAGLNRADLLQRRGLYPPPPGVPQDIPGLEFAGEIEGTGRRVMGIVAGGAQAERLAVHEAMCLPVPPGMGFTDAAAIPEAYLTAYDALFERAHLVRGETVLIHAAASGVGLAAAAIAEASGCRVIALSRTDAKRRRLAELGYETALDPSAAVDVVIDFVGAATWGLNLEHLAPKGRLVLVGTLSGGRVEADLHVLMAKRLTVVGTVLRSRPVEEKIALARGFSRAILPLFEGGRLRPIVDRVVPLSEAAAAHAAMERNENFGKIVLTL
jgi:putative PIG3 family NAD(P)H quinone oxidoreductase